MIKKETIYMAKNPTTARDATPIASLIFFFFSCSKLTGISKISSSKTYPLVSYGYSGSGCKFLATQFDDLTDFIDFTGGGVILYV